LNFYGSDVFTLFPEHAALFEHKTQRASTVQYKSTEYGYACRISSITIEEVEEVPVYNLEVEDDHTYVANGIAVHNCTANAIAGAIEFEQIKQNMPQVFIPSRLFIYYNERVTEGTVNSDSGAQIRDGMKSVGTLGDCPEDMWPYDIANFQEKPTDACYQTALQHRAILYQRVNRNLAEMKGCLASGYPFVFGFTVHKSFMTQQVATTGIVPMPQPQEALVGGHACCIVGYDTAQQIFYFRNSWGVGWNPND
jgi:C1A family cysteine protease